MGKLPLSYFSLSAFSRSLAISSLSSFSVGKYVVSPSNPLIGYINYESKVRYKVRIIGIICNKIAKLYPNKWERPEEWDDSKWKTFFRVNKFEEINPIDTTSFNKPNGEFVKHPPQNYVEVVD